MHVRLVMMCLSTAIDKKVLEVDDESIPCFCSSLRLAGVSCSSRCNGYVSTKGKDIGYFFFFILYRWKERVKREGKCSFIEVRNRRNYTNR